MAGRTSKVVAITTATVGLLAGLAGTAHAQNVWHCGSGLCTRTVVDRAPLYESAAMTRINFYLPRGTVIYLDCYVADWSSGTPRNVRYNSGTDNYGGGWVRGAHVDTGHDPYPESGLCT